MCFGDSKKTTTSSSTTKPPDWLTNAGQSNLNYAANLQNTGFTPYTGQQVAGFSPQQQSSFGLGDQLATGYAPHVGQAGGLISNYANAGPQNVTADPIYSQMSPYMNQYVNMALAPQLQMQNQQFADQNKAVDASAAMAGAFGDTGWGQLRGTTTQAQTAARSGLIGNAYNAAFNTAIGAGAQDAANRLNASTANANYAETALNRQLGGATALTNLGGQAINMQNTLGAQQTAATQADLNARYNQWLMAQQYPFQTTQLMNSTLGAVKGVSPIQNDSTSTQSQPDNSGWGMLGSLAGAGMNMLLPGSGMLMGAVGGMGGQTSPAMSPGFQGWTGATGVGGWQNPDYRADGGVLTPGKPTVVGERGPEVIIPNATGVVIPNEVMAAAIEKRDAKKKKKPAAMPSGLEVQLGAVA